MITSLVLLCVIVILVLWRNYSQRPSIPLGLKSLPGPKGMQDKLSYISYIKQHRLANTWIRPWSSKGPELDKVCRLVCLFYRLRNYTNNLRGKQYGPIYQVNLAGNNHVWISRDDIARDLLAKKGAIYSDRPHIPALIDDNRDSGQYLPLMSRNGQFSNFLISFVLTPF